MYTIKGTFIDRCDHDVELSKVCQSLWELDENRLVPGKDYEINLQAGSDMYYYS